MKNLPIFILLLLTGIIKSQDKKVYVEYEITNLSTGNPIYVKAKLFVDKTKSVYTINPKDTKYNKEEKATYNENDNTITRIIYKSSNTAFFLITDKLKDSLEFNSTTKETKLIVQEKIHPFKWTIHKDTKKIGDFNCIKATTYFRGRDYIAWYSPKIPISHGPWKFNGLPGLIFEIKSKDGNISFTLDKFEESNFKNNEISKPNNGDKITFNQYVVNKKESVNDFLKNLMVKLPRGSKVKLNSKPIDYNIETNFD